MMPPPASAWFSPRRRRWSDVRDVAAPRDVVLSAQAEVVRVAVAPAGDAAGFSPRRRRWSGPRRAGPADRAVLSAQAEVVRPRASRFARSSRSLRAGGGGPAHHRSRLLTRPFSPRRRRWSAEGRELRTPGPVLSAQAEVVRDMRGLHVLQLRSLRAGGGGPLPPQRARPLVGSLRAGGGGPRSPIASAHGTAFSPRRRRWSGGRLVPLQPQGVLSAQAEVVRPQGPRPATSSTFSPRRRRWSGGFVTLASTCGVLSAQAEVVRWRRRRAASPSGSLRAGGGGPISVKKPGSLSSVLSAQAEVVRPRSRPNSGRGCSLRAGGGDPRTRLPCPRPGWFSPRRRRWSVGDVGAEPQARVLSA